MSATTAKATLQNYHALTERQYKGDVDAIVALADLAVAVERAGLTARQAEALALVYGADMTQADAAKRMGVQQPNVVAYVNAAIEKIDEIYEYNAWHDGDLMEGDFANDDDTDTAAGA